MKNIIKKIQTLFIFALGSLVTNPTCLLAADLLNAELNDDGQLVVPNKEEGGNGLVGAFQQFMDKANVIVAGVTGCLTIIMVLLFTWKCFEFAKSSNNPGARANAITGIIVFAIAAALFGSATLFTGLAYNLFG